MAFRDELRVLVVDQNALTRFAIIAVVNLFPNLRVCAEADDACSARSGYIGEKPHIIFVDVMIPRGDGIELVAELSKQDMSASWIIISDICDPMTVRRALRAGASGYVSKCDEPAQIFAAIAAAMSKNKYISKRVSEGLQIDFSCQRNLRWLNLLGLLSDREFHVFRRIARGQGISAIARELGVSVKTAETHQTRIKEKLELKSCDELRRVACRWWKRRSVQSCC